jgi:hypothetical protein
MFGKSPHLKSRAPPYCEGMDSGSMNVSRVDLTSADERMKILDTVTGSNQRFIQFQTVGKKEGAPMILNPC